MTIWRKVEAWEYVVCDVCDGAGVETSATFVEIDGDAAARTTDYDGALPSWFIRGARRAVCSAHVVGP